jgi:ribulose kinase
MIGLGVLEDGQLGLLTGSSHLLLGMTSRPIHGEGIWGSYSDALIPGLGILEGGQTSTGSVINWFKKLVGGATYDELNREAEAVPPGAEGLLCSDHFQVRQILKCRGEEVFFSFTFSRMSL